MKEKCKRTSSLDEASRASSPSKRRKLSVVENSHLINLSNSELESDNSPSCESFGSGGDLCSSLCSDHCVESRCSSNDSGEVVKEMFKLIDLQANVSETEISSSINSKFSQNTSQTSQSSELCGDNSEDTESPTNLRRKILASKIPPQAEIEEFFASAEKRDRQRFAEKYNYDIVKDLPLEGRYEWIPLKP